MNRSLARLIGARLLALIMTAAASCGRSPDETAVPGRREFAARMGEVKVGMEERQVLELLGEPSDVVRRSDKIICSTDTEEILGWGNGRNLKQVIRDGVVSFRPGGTHLSFPTLGCVHLDQAHRVRRVFGAGPFEPLDIAEPRLRELLELVDTAGPISRGSYTPTSIINVVNALIPLGKDRALAVIGEYLRVASRPGLRACDGLFAVLRVLFDVPSAEDAHPRVDPDVANRFRGWACWSASDIVGGRRSRPERGQRHVRIGDDEYGGRWRAPARARRQSRGSGPEAVCNIRVEIGVAHPAGREALFGGARFPIVLADDIPYLVVDGYRSTARRQPVEEHLRYYRRHGVLRRATLAPKPSRRAELDGLTGRIGASGDALPDFEAQRTSVVGRSP